MDPAEETLRLYEAIREESLGAEGQPHWLAELSPAPLQRLTVLRRGRCPLFFGREALTGRLLEHVHQMSAARKKGRNQPASCFLAVVGASGSGKSSVSPSP